MNTADFIDETAQRLHQSIIEAWEEEHAAIVTSERMSYHTYYVGLALFEAEVVKGISNCLWDQLRNSVSPMWKIEKSDEAHLWPPNAGTSMF